MTRILLVEDEDSLVTALSEYLRREGIEVVVARTCAAARTLISGPPSVVILDWMLPDGQGVDLVREWRSQGLRIPIVMLTARSDLIDKVVGLELGANDYMTKPFEPRELLARLRVQLRAAAAIPAPDETLRCAGIDMNLATREVTFAGLRVELTRMEFSLLRLLIENPDRVFTRDELLNKVWGFESYPTTRTVDTHILQLRQKFSADLFLTVRGVGYRLKAPQG